MLAHVGILTKLESPIADLWECCSAATDAGTVLQWREAGLAVSSVLVLCAAIAPAEQAAASDVSNTCSSCRGGELKLDGHISRHHVGNACHACWGHPDRRITLTSALKRLLWTTHNTCLSLWSG